VLATLHTTDATQTLQRILSFFPEDARAQAALDLSIALRGVLSQRLLPRQDGNGRVLAVEMLTMSPAIARLLREQETELLPDIMRADAGPGMVTFNESMLKLYREGVITLETGVAYATNPDEFALWAKGMTTSVDSFRTGADKADVGVFDMKGLLTAAVQADASDLHIAVGRPPILRVSGQLRPLGKNRLTDADVRTLLFSIMSQRQRTLYELEREVDFALAMDDGKRFRVNAYFQKGRMAAAMRAIATSVPDAATLRIPDPVLKLGEKPQGLVLVVGPTGSGKSTTLACLVDRINRTRACRIITVEDPIEYVHPSRLATVDQREVSADTKSFSAALKYVLRQDPDVILVGEMRDLETIHAALTAAETGHLVFATLHTNDAVQAIDRIIDVFPSAQQSQVRSQLSSALNGVVSQRLLPKRGGGRVAAYEVMIGTPAIKNLIRDNKMHQALGIMEASQREGCQTLDQHVQQLFTEGLIPADEASRYMRNGRVQTATTPRY
jgi:twitching motility protein PilT